jgi:hypothetical protein
MNNLTALAIGTLLAWMAIGVFLYGVAVLYPKGDK